jgi:hypothetical protein
MQADEFAPFRRAVIDPRYRPALIKKGWYFPAAITNIAQHLIAGFHFLCMTSRQQPPRQKEGQCR